MSDFIRPSRLARLAFGALVLILTATVTARADLLFFKDGFVLEGKVRRESKVEFDPVAREPVVIPQGFFLLDDGARNVYFSPTQVRIVEKKPRAVEEHITHKLVKYILRPRRLPPLREVVEAPAFDAGWQRVFRFHSPDGLVTVPQHLGQIGPYWARIDATDKYFWSCAYLTRELGPEAVQALLEAHPDFKDRPNLKAPQRAAQRMRLCDFYAQAGWFDLAEQQLDRLLKDQPDQKDRVEAARKALSQLRARELFEEVKRLHVAGQPEAVRKRATAFPPKHATEEMLAFLREVQTADDAARAQVEQAGRYLDELARGLTDPHHRLLAEAAAVIRSELHPANVERLAAFLGQARQAERQRTKGKAPDLAPAPLLSLAVSGWLLGSPSAEARPEAAVALWRARQLILAYQREADPASRARLLRDYEAGLKTQGPTFDEIAQMVPLLPPPDAAAALPAGPVEVPVLRPRGAAGTYLLQLPPEYTHRRSYPVLIVLHQVGEKPADMLRRWQSAAAENGYILAAPAWERGGGFSTGAADTGLVLDTLRDLRRRFQVDSDRVFLFGLGEGGRLAFDVGLSHPDLFAGVLPMGAAPDAYGERCWRNGQYLPFYVVTGNRSGDSERLRKQFTHWAQRGYPMLWVDYKGRGVEWLAGEVPNMFDWMRVKRRAFPLYQLGTDGLGGQFGNEFCTMRPGDNHFYWLSSDDVSPACCISARGMPRLGPATLHARVGQTTNDIRLRLTGLRRATVWLGRNARGESTIDFDRPVSVWVGLKASVYQKRIAPSLGTLLEDLYRRGDRQQLFLARIDLQLR